MSKRISEVAEGVFRITLVQPREEVTTKVHVFLIPKSNNGYILVDSGWRHTARDLVGAVQAEFGRQARIEDLVLTHLHPDHYGGAQSVVEQFAPRIVYHRAELVAREKERYLAWIEKLSVPRRVLMMIFTNFDARSSQIPLADKWLDKGAVVDSSAGRWSLVHTAGHTPGHVCLFQEESRILISGDHLLPNESSNVGSYPLRGYYPLNSYLANLTKVTALRPSMVIPSHGAPFTGVKERVSELFEHHKERLREVFDELGSGPRTPTEVAKSVRWSRGSFESLEGFNKWLAISETLSHLEFLRKASVARRMGRTAIFYELRARDWSAVENAVDDLAPR